MNKQSLPQYLTVKSTNIIQYLPSGKHTKSYWKLPFIVSFPIKNGGSFQFAMLVYQDLTQSSANSKPVFFTAARLPKSTASWTLCASGEVSVYLLPPSSALKFTAMSLKPCLYLYEPRENHGKQAVFGDGSQMRTWHTKISQVLSVLVLSHVHKMSWDQY